jgi:hypothetical protein
MVLFSNHTFVLLLKTPPKPTQQLLFSTAAKPASQMVVLGLFLLLTAGSICKICRAIC